MLLRPGTMISSSRGTGEASAIWTPASLPNLIGWWEPAVTTSLYEERTGGGTTPSSVNGVVGTIRDLSGSANHLVAPSDAARPLYKTAGGLTWLEFDGVDDRVRLAFTWNQPAFRCSGFEQLSYTSGERLIDGGSPGVFALSQGASSGTLTRTSGTALTSTRAVGVDFVATEVSAAGGSGSYVEIDNEAEVTFAIASNPAGITIGGRGDGLAANICHMRWYGTIALSALPSAEDKARIKTYMGARTGVTL